jgi:DNA-binding GntR family transcriptional regulator
MLSETTLGGVMVRGDKDEGRSGTAYLKIKNLLLKQGFSEGRKLIYRELAEKFHMSLTPVQQALARLEQEGFVKREHNIGYFVKGITLKESNDLFDMKRALEVYAVGLAIENQTPQDMECLNKLAQDHKNHVIQTYDRKKILLDAAFHYQIVRMSKNWEILKQVQRIYEHSYLRFPIESLPPSRGLVSSSQHEEIVHWIKERNASRARRCLDRHILDAKKAKITVLCADS